MRLGSFKALQHSCGTLVSTAVNICLERGIRPQTESRTDSPEKKWVNPFHIKNRYESPKREGSLKPVHTEMITETVKTNIAGWTKSVVAVYRVLSTIHF